MQSRLEAITKLFKDNLCYEDFDPGQIVEISNCTTPQLFEKMMQDYQVLKQNFQKELIEILLAEVQNSEDKIDSSVSYKDIFQYQDLKKIAEKVSKLKGSFSYKQIQRIQLKLFCLLHSQLLSQNTLEKYEDIDLRQQINLLQQSIKKESKWSESFEQIFIRLAKTQDFSNLLAILEDIKKQLMIINIDQLVNLINKSRAAQNIMEDGCGIVFIGSTGAGKTTTILSLLGHLIENKKWAGINWATPKYLLNIEGVKNLVACPSSKSITRNVTAIELLRGKNQIRKQNIYFVDTPGFKDTQGSIMDLSNTFGTSHAIKSLKKAKFVILLSGKDQGSRYQGLVDITQILNELFPDYLKVKNSVVLFFNRYSKEDMECISQSLAKVWKDLPKSSQDSKNLENIFKDFQEKTSKKETHFIFDPIGKDKSYSQSINKAISEYPWVSDLDDLFSVCYGQRAKKDIQRQVGNLKEYCLYYFKVGEVEIAKYFIQQLEQLRDILGKETAPQVVSNNFKIIKTQMLEQIRKKYQNVSRQFIKVIDAWSLSQKDIDEYFNEIKELDAYLTLEQYFDITDIKNKLISNINDKIDSIVSEVKKQIRRMDEKSMICLSLLVKTFKRNDCYEQICSVFNIKIKQKMDLYKGKIQLSDFDESVEFYESSKTLLNLYSIFSTKKGEIEKMFLIDDVIQTEIKQQHGSISSFVQNFADCSPQKFKQIRKVSQYVGKLEISLKFLRSISNYQQILLLVSEFIVFLTKNAEQNLQQCEEYLTGRQNLSPATVNKISKFYAQISQMKQIPHLKTLVTNKSRTIDYKIASCLDNEKKVLEGFIEQIKREKINFAEIKREVRRLDQSALRIQRVLKFQSNRQEITLDDVVNKIKYFFEDILNKVESMSKSKKNIFDDKHNQFEKLGQIVEMLQAFNLEQKKQRQSKLLQDQDLITNYKEIKQKSQNIFTNKFSEIQKITTKLIDQGKHKLDTQPFKYCNVKFKQIQLCLNFIDLGKKIFDSIQEKYAKFEHAQTKLVEQIRKWESQLMQSLEALFQKLRETQKQDYVSVVKQLKKKILILQEIKKKYRLIESLLQPSTQSYVEQELSPQINEIIKIHQKLINRFVQLQNPVNQISYLITKCQTLSTLDCFIDENSNFRRLEEDIQVKIQKFTKSLDNKFKFALDLKNYDDVLKILESMSCNEKELFDESESQFCKVVQKQVNEISNRKFKEYENQHHLEFIIQELGELNRIRKVISSNEKMKTPNILKLLSNISDTVKSLSTDIQSYYLRFIDEIESKIKQKRIYQAHVQISLFNKRKNILMCNEIKDKIDFKRWEELEEKIKGIITLFQTNYISNPKPDLSKFREEYEEIFANTVTSGELISLKKKIEGVIDNLVQQKEKEMDSKDSFNKLDLTQIKDFINQLPEYFKNKIRCQKLETSAQQKFQNWQKQIAALSTEARQLPIFQNQTLNKRIITYFKGKQLDKNAKSILTTNLMNSLEQLIKQWGQDFNIFVQKTVESKQLLSLKSCKNEKGLEEINKIYEMKLTEIDKKTAQLFNNQIYQIQQLSIEPKQIQFKDGQLKLKIENRITHLLKSLSVLEKKCQPTLNTEQLIKERLNQYVQSLIKCHRKNVGFINNMKICLDFSQDDSKLQEQIRSIKYVYIIEYCLLELIKKGETAGYSNKYTNQICNIIKQKQKDLMIEKYKSIIKDQIMPKYEQCLNFSLQSKTVYSMSENDLKKELKEKQCCNKYMIYHLPNLLASLGKNEEKQLKVDEICKHNNKVHQQAQQMVNEIMNYANQPSIDDKRIEKIKSNLLIIKHYSLYYLKFKTQVAFNSQIQKYHSDKSKQIQDLLNNLKSNTDNYENNNVLKRKQMTGTIKTKEEEIKAAFQIKLKKMQAKYETQIKEKQNQEKQKIENIYQTEVKEQNTLQKEQINKMKTDVQNQLNESQKKHFQEIKDTFSQIADLFIGLTIITNNFISRKEFIDKNKKIINSIYRMGKKKWLQIFVTCLNEIGSTTAKLIIYDNPDLNRLTQNHFMKNIQSLTIDQLMNKMTQSNSNIDEDFRKQLKKKIESCKTAYYERLTDYKSKGQGIKDNLIKSLKQPAEAKEQVKNQQNLKKVASILALWTIIQSIQQDGQIIYTYNPHPVQIITLIILLGFVSLKQRSGCQSRFAEVRTGEGKSLIFAVMSVYFALKNLSVDCVCYSEHLSSRDKSHFQQLFELLGVESRINYCTFNDLTETLLEKGEIKVREQCINLSKKNAHKNGNIGKLRSYFTSDKFASEKKILLLDEADVFFMDEFYGNTYTPSFQLKSEHIKNLYSLIWDKRNQLNKLRKEIKSSQQFLKIVQQFSQFVELIENHLPHMFEAAENFKHSYLTEDDRILYKDQDGYTDKISYGYRTIFAYFYQFGRKNISKLPLQVYSLTLSICQISYAELPKIYPCIIGVTGTLSSLPQCKRKVMKQKYKIEQNYFMPSIYKESKRDDKGYCIVQTQKQFQQVVENLKPYHVNNRPILIFFDNLDNLNRFYHSKLFKPYQDQTALMHEKHNAQQRKERIMRATTKGKITLITSSFGRGTDFIIYEDQVINKGGVHLIVTYLPEDKSQQVQLLGRVGRQGNPGSSIFILSTQQITSKLGYSYQYLEKQNTSKIQEVLVQIRQRQSNDKQIQLSLQINNCLIKHNESLKLFNEIKNKQYEDAFQKIIKMNLLPVIHITKNPVKTILALDATISMSSALAATKSSLTQSFDRVYKILQKQHVQSGFSVQIVLYRNYNVKENQLIETTPFEITAEPLINFIKTVQLKGGWGNQALEVVYNHSLNEQNLKQIIIITDALPNTQKQIRQKRNYLFKEAYWTLTQNFKSPLETQQLLMKIRQQKIIINALPIGKNIKESYDKICKQSGGQCQLFEPNLNNHVDTMTNFIATSILSKLGDDQRVSTILVDSYRKTYNK